MAGPDLDVPALARAIADTTSAIDSADLTILVSRSTKRTLAAGDALIHEGTWAGALFIVVSGDLAVTLDDGTVLGHCGPGNVIGELSLLDRQPASATVTAASAVVALAIDRDTFDTLGATEPRAATALLKLVCTAVARRVRTSSDLFETLVTDPDHAPAPPRSSFVGVLKALFGTRAESAS